MVASKTKRGDARYQERYGKSWTAKSRKCKQLQPFCCFPDCWNLAQFEHHALYADQAGAVKDGELQHIHLFELCDTHHTNGNSPEANPDCAHHPANWFPGTGEPPRLNAQNTAAYYRRMREGAAQKMRFQSFLLTRKLELDSVKKYRLLELARLVKEFKAWDE